MMGIFFCQARYPSFFRLNNMLPGDMLVIERGVLPLLLSLILICARRGIVSTRSTPTEGVEPLSSLDLYPIA